MYREAQDNICAFFECEGYLFGNEYTPCEIALLSKKDARVYSVKHDLNMVGRSADIARDVQRHGIPFDWKEGLALDEICDLINKFYDMVKDNKHFVIGVSTAAASDILHNLGIPYVVFPDKVNDRKPCFLHKLKNSDRSCALASVLGMMDWFIQQEEDEKLFQTPYDTCDYFSWPENRKRNFKTVEKVACRFCNKRHFDKTPE